MKPLRIYIACPYTLGDVGVNIRSSQLAAEQIRNAGHYPFNPLLFHYQHVFCPRDYNDWIEQCLQWLSVCDAVVRLPGESRGADVEVERAGQLGIPVYRSVFDLIHNPPGPPRVHCALHGAYCEDE